MAAPFASAQVNFNQIAIDSGDISSNGIAVGDFDGDGILDFVTINYSTLSFYKGLGGGNYRQSREPVDHAEPWASDGGRFQSRWQTRSGCSCRASVSQEAINIFLGNGDGTFRPGTYIALPGTQHFLTLADFNGDHLPDIAVSDARERRFTWARATAPSSSLPA